MTLSKSKPIGFFTSNKMNLYTCAVLLLVLVLSNTVQSQFPEKLLQNPCVSKTTCRDCIQTKSCAWCMQPEFGDKPRCFQPSLSSFTGGCPEEYTWNPDHEERLIIHKELTRASGSGRIGGGAAVSGGSYEASSSRESYGSSSYSGSSYSKTSEFSGSHSSKGVKTSTNYGSYSESGKIVQIYPQRVGLKLRISTYTFAVIASQQFESQRKLTNDLICPTDEEHRLNIQYSQAQDYPVDLYYLMDLSKSMEDDKEKLSKLGDLLTDTMRNMTSNFRLGFGSFVDKVLMPYVSTVPKK